MAPAGDWRPDPGDAGARRRASRLPLAASWAQAIIEIHRMAWVERREPTWGKQHWHGFVQSLPPSFAAESREP
ncbi:hypothetical protein LNP74_29975 [Klebsiella pneumoniae subsp. pneumoniae]|nr:hypothetical protein [Klebsiella pneumoniae subsp. pneumoniae]